VNKIISVDVNVARLRLTRGEGGITTPPLVPAGRGCADWSGVEEGSVRDFVPRNDPTRYSALEEILFSQRLA